MENTHVGPFLIVKRLGTNRRQRVFHARHVKQGRDVALKFINLPPDVDWDRAIDKINLEVEILKQLKHPNLVRVYGAGVDGDQIFLCSELADGESLTSLLARRGRLAPDLVVEIGRQIAELLEYLHQQDILHCKLTPDKIIVDQNNQVKVADLRLNRTRRKRWDSPRKRELDIAAYMAPELMNEGATNKSDLYSLGVILYEMLTGKLPYPPDTIGRMTRMKLEEEPPSVAEHVLNCPIWLDQIITQMLASDPRKRPHSARAVVFALSEIKNNDQAQKPVVEMVTGNFNPLTAGVDKSEARRLLGQPTPQFERPNVQKTPFYESVPFLVACLVVIASIIGYALMPTSSEKLYQQAETLMDSSDSDHWFEARTPLKTIMDRGPTDPFYDQARDLYFESRRRTMVAWAENGRPLWTQSQNTQKIGEAIRLQKDGDLEEAKRRFKELTDTVDPNGDERHVYLEAQARFEQLEEATRLPDTPDRLLAVIKQLEQASSRDELMEARRRLGDILFKFGGRDGYKEVLQAAQQTLTVIRQRLDQLEGAGDSEEWPAESNRSNRDSGDGDPDEG